jgi:3-oxoacyl-[acyl-carrier-protein] synthase III
MVQSVAKKLEIPIERVIVTLQDNCNALATSVLLAFDTGVRSGGRKKASCFWHTAASWLWARQAPFT